MNRTGQQEAQVLAALRAAPLDRIRLMKTLFRFLALKRAPGFWTVYLSVDVLIGSPAVELYKRVQDREGFRDLIFRIERLRLGENDRGAVRYSLDVRPRRTVYWRLALLRRITIRAPTSD